MHPRPVLLGVAERLVEGVYYNGAKGLEPLVRDLGGDLLPKQDRVALCRAEAWRDANSGDKNFRPWNTVRGAVTDNALLDALGILCRNIDDSAAVLASASREVAPERRQDGHVNE